MIPYTPLLTDGLQVILKKENVKIRVDNRDRGIGNVFITRRDVRWISNEGDGIVIKLSEITQIKCCQEKVDVVDIDVEVRDGVGLGLINPEEPHKLVFEIEIKMEAAKDADDVFQKIILWMLPEMATPIPSLEYYNRNYLVANGFMLESDHGSDSETEEISNEGQGEGEAHNENHGDGEAHGGKHGEGEGEGKVHGDHANGEGDKKAVGGDEGEEHGEGIGEYHGNSGGKVQGENRYPELMALAVGVQNLKMASIGKAELGSDMDIDPMSDFDEQTGIPKI